jgi:hypothetical protein
MLMMVYVRRISHKTIGNIEPSSVDDFPSPLHPKSTCWNSKQAYVVLFVDIYQLELFNQCVF